MGRDIAMAFLVPGPVVIVVEDDGGGERKVLDDVGQRHGRETGVEAMGVDACDCESWETERGGPLLVLRIREDETRSPLSPFRLGRPKMWEESASLPLVLERGM